MRISYDPEVDALSIIFRDTTVTTQELAEGIAAEYDAQGRLVGIEILDAVKRLGDPSVLQQVILERLGPAAPSPLSRP
jgi:YD repeat-containing protein